VIGAIVQYGILILVIVAALGQMGIQTASLLGVLGAAGLAIGLALQGTLSNIAAGLMLLWLRPFRTGDFIEVNGMMGTVREIGLFVSHLETFDGLYIFAPNSAIWNQPLRNHSRNAGRLVSINVTLPSEADIERARKILLGMVQADQCVLKVPKPRIFVESLTGSGLLLNLRVWASHENVAVVQRTIIEKANCALEGAAVEKLQPQQVVRAVLAAPFLSATLGPVMPSVIKRASRWC
jgi:small conductance mechanosensitive channel